MSRELNFNEWMEYIHKSVNKSEIGKRSLNEIYKEIQELQKIDKIISERVRSTYTLKG